MSTLAEAGLFRMRLWTGLSAEAGVNECRSRSGQSRSRARPLMLPLACCGCGGRRRDAPRTDTDKVFGFCLPVCLGAEFQRDRGLLRVEGAHLKGPEPFS